MILCWACAGEGLFVPGNVCVVCDGIGAFPRLRISLPVLRIEAQSRDGWRNRRVVVISVAGQGANGQATIHCLSELGDPLTLTVEASRLARAPTVVLEEIGDWV